tara:strand:- start:5957 stop:7081 length:1125 start_codon:yes stop_codon:yes gene_type:complete
MKVNIMGKHCPSMSNNIDGERFEDIVQLAQELKRQATSKLDLIVDTRSLRAEAPTDDDSNEVKLVIPETGTYPLTGWAHSQVSSKLGIPKRYYDRMNDSAPELLAANINQWLGSTKARMVRLLEATPGEGIKVRAFLSDRYRVLDNEALLHASLSALREVPGEIDIAEASLTRTKMYLKALRPKQTAEVRKGERVSSGIIISNSEVGSGGVQVAPFFMFLSCSNGMVGTETLRRIHLGSKNELGELTSQTTQDLQDAALWSQIKDLIFTTFDDEGFDKMLNQFRLAAEIEVANPVEAVGNVVQQFDLSEEQGTSLLEEFSTSKDFTKYGLFNAVTATAKTIGGIEDQVTWETIGGKIAAMDGDAFERIAAPVVS